MENIIIVEHPKFSKVCHNYWLWPNGEINIYSTDEGDRVDAVPIDLYQVKEGCQEWEVGEWIIEKDDSTPFSPWKLMKITFIQPISEAIHCATHLTDGNEMKIIASTNEDLEFPQIPRETLTNFIEEHNKSLLHIQTH